MSLDSCLVELRHLRTEMNGISPKLSTYAKLKVREKELLEMIGKREGPSHEQKVNALHRIRTMRCPVEACPNLRQIVGGSKNALGVPKRRGMCAHHRKEKNAKT